MRGFGDYPGLDRYFDSDDELPDKNKPKKTVNKPKVESAIDPKPHNNFFQQYVKHQIDKNQAQRNPQVIRNQQPQKNPTYKQKIQNNEQKLNQLLFQKTMEISNLQSKCAAIEKELQAQKESSKVLERTIKENENLIAVKQLIIKDYEQQTKNLRYQIIRIQKKGGNIIENKEELQSLMDQMFEENKTIRSKLQYLKKQYGKYQKLINLMKDQEIQEILEIVDHYESQMRQFKEHIFPKEPTRCELMSELKERCEFLEVFCRRVMQKNSISGNQMKRIEQQYNEYLQRYTSEVRKVETNLTESDYQLKNLLQNFIQ